MKRATRDYHPARRIADDTQAGTAPIHEIEIPAARKDVLVRIADREIKLTNLSKVFWNELGLTKRDLLQYYADLSPFLLPHLKDRAMVMKRTRTALTRPSRPSRLEARVSGPKRPTLLASDLVLLPLLRGGLFRGCP